jgi:hypothetical protein
MAKQSNASERRESFADAHAGGGIGGFLSNWVNSKPAEKK